MKKNLRIIQAAFGVPWLIFGLQHFLFANVVAHMVPRFVPLRLFWAYFTGAAMIAAGVALIANVKARLAAALLGAMLLGFVLLIHIPKLSGFTSAQIAVIDWTRALQDLAIASSTVMLTGTLARQDGERDFLDKIARASRYVFAILLIFFGAQHFLNLDFVTAKVAVYLPLRIFWVYLTGMAIIATGVCVLINKKARLAAFGLATWMLVLNLLLHVYLLANAPHVPLLWTGAMLDFAITCGVFILAATSPHEKSARFDEIAGSTAQTTNSVELQP